MLRLPRPASRFDRDGGKVVTIADDSCVLFDVKANKVIVRAESKAAPFHPFAAFSPRGDHLAAVECGGNSVGQLVLFDTSSGERVRSFEAFAGEPLFSPDGRTVAVLGDHAAIYETASGQLRVKELEGWWRLPRGNRDRRCGFSYPATFDRAGERLIVQDKDSASVFDASRGRLLRTLSQRCGA